MPAIAAKDFLLHPLNGTTPARPYDDVGTFSMCLSGNHTGCLSEVPIFGVDPKVGMFVCDCKCHDDFDLDDCYEFFKFSECLSGWHEYCHEIDNVEEEMCSCTCHEDSERNLILQAYDDICVEFGIDDISDFETIKAILMAQKENKVLAQEGLALLETIQSW